jgi:hypothetical protein
VNLADGLGDVDDPLIGELRRVDSRNALYPGATDVLDSAVQLRELPRSDIRAR